MKTMKAIIAVESLGFFIVIILLWLDELLDIPHLIFDAPATPANYTEIAFETAVVLILAVLVGLISISMVRRIKKLERMFPVCLVCEKVCLPGHDREKQESWQSMDLFAIDRKGLRVSNDLCPKCRDEQKC